MWVHVFPVSEAAKGHFIAPCGHTSQSPLQLALGCTAAQHLRGSRTELASLNVHLAGLSISIVVHDYCRTSFNIYLGEFSVKLNN